MGSYFWADCELLCGAENGVVSGSGYGQVRALVIAVMNLGVP